MFEGFKVRRAYLLHMRGRLEEARRLYEEVFATGYDVAKYHALYSMLLLSLCDFESARDFLRESLDFFETRLAKLQKYKDFKGRPRTDKRFTGRNRAEMRLNLALSLWKTGDVDAAVKEARTVYEDYHTATVYGTLGFLLIAQGDRTGSYSEAEALNLEALEFDEDAYNDRIPRMKRESAVIQDNLGQLYYRKGETDKAKDYFNRALTRRDDQADTLYYLARIALEEGRGEEARALIEKLYARAHFSPLNTVSREDMDALREGVLSEA